MTSRGIIGLGFLGNVVFVIVSGILGVAQSATTPVKIGNNCTTDQPAVSISINGQVSWTAVDQTYTLNFTNSPFTGIASGTSFAVPVPQTKSSGPVTNQVKQQCQNNTNLNNPACRFKYSVRGSVGPTPCKDVPTADPVVIITH